MESNNNESKRCWYCGKQLDDNKSNYQKVMYYETNRVSTAVEFKSGLLSVPRCEECEKTHKKGGVFSKVFIALYIALLVWAIISADNGSIDKSPRTVLFIGLGGLVALVLLFRYLKSNRAANAGIKKEDDLEGYLPYEELKMQGWKDERPSA